MTLQSPKHKLSSNDDFVQEARQLVRRMSKHILEENCQHCRHILEPKNNDD